ncbi:MAG: hypothetical protein EHM35_15840 [Planctomycetaceae bacterium]|nr:MAG: hypothetical protein EHM35_15840 [Planctomycetaceae bacterium]
MTTAERIRQLEADRICIETQRRCYRIILGTQGQPVQVPEPTAEVLHQLVPVVQHGLTMATAGEPVTATRLSEMDGAIVRPPC